MTKRQGSMMTRGAGAQPEYDYIVVGSGAGGGVVAARLAKAGMKVLLLEAGGEAEPASYQVPAFHALATEDPALKWDFFVRHYADDRQQHRDSKFCKQRNGVLYPRAGTLGGCTAHNAMITVYPHNRDWDEIAKITGDRSWRHKKMRKYFQRLEMCDHRPGWKWLERFGWNPSRHGFHGWLSTQIAIPRATLGDFRLVKVIVNSAWAAFKELGFPLKRLKGELESFGDPNDWRVVDAEGIYYTPLATHGHARNGTRELIRTARRKFCKNLTVKTNCLATRVLLDDSNTAVGVEYLEGEHLYEADPCYSSNDRGETRKSYVSREVILAAGAFNTPQLLMLSGIGPEEELRCHDIRVRVSLPGVGRNLQDRYEVGVVNQMKEDWRILRDAQFNESDPPYQEWAKSRRGIYTTNGAILGIAKNSDQSRQAGEPPDLFIVALLGRFAGFYPGYSSRLAQQRNYLTWTILKAHTRNTAGRVTLKSADPRATPCINFHYFDAGNDRTEKDLESVVDGVLFARALTRPLRHLIEKEDLPGSKLTTRDEIKQFVRDEAWGHHASCTCKIGPREQCGVLDGNFRVHGTRNLRVVDASVFPRTPGLLIVTSVYMVAEKASEVILADAKPRSRWARLLLRRRAAKRAKRSRRPTEISGTPGS